eukprot:1602115-Alexandrium_andersonii.AAC.1
MLPKPIRSPSKDPLHACTWEGGGARAMCDSAIEPFSLKEHACLARLSLTNARCSFTRHHGP